MKRELSSDLTSACRAFLGKDGIAFFSKVKREHGKVNAVFMEGGIPHPVHFREGMQIRNWMRGQSETDGWDDHDYDDTWVPLVEAAIIGKSG